MPERKRRFPISSIVLAFATVLDLPTKGKVAQEIELAR